MSNNEDIKKANEELERLKQDEREEWLAFSRLMYRMDKKAQEDYAFEKGLNEGREAGMKQGMEEGRKEGRKEGIKKGREEGIKQGIREGIKENQKQIILNMHKKQMPIEYICEIAGLKKEEVEKIIEEDI